MATNARVLFVGIGGLGSPALLAMARAGVGTLFGTLGLADDDVVEETNLHRQILFDESDVGQPKVHAAARALARWMPRQDVSELRVREHSSRLLPANALELLSAYDLVVEGSDNFATKFLTADACRIARVPVVHAAAVRWHGTVLAVGGDGKPCYRCLFEDVPRDHAPNCSEAGVMGPVVGIVGALQADLALSMLEGKGVAGTVVTYDGKTDALRRRTVQPRADCRLCGNGEPRIETMDAPRYAADACD